MLSACAEDDAPDFCGDHAAFHADHQEDSAQLVVEMFADGRVHSEIQMSYSITHEEQAVARLSDVATVLQLETSSECGAASVDVESSGGMIRATYSSDCGADNKLGQVNVLLFDAFPEVDEVVVHVTTPVTKKHFAIHRQCASAIFRLE